MPIYEFHCVKCDIEFEELCLSSNSVSSISCPQCKGVENERIMSLFATSSGNSASEAQASTSKSSCATCSGSSCKICSSR